MKGLDRVIKSYEKELKIKKQGLWTIVSVVVALGLILASCAKAPAPTAPTAPKPAVPGVIKWLGQTSSPPTPPIPGPMNGMRYPAASGYGLIDLIERYSGGRLQIERVPWDSIVSSTEGLAGTARGAIDIMFGMLHSTAAGIIAEADILNGLPLMYQEWEEAYDAFYNWGLLDQIQPLFEKENVHLIPAIGASWNVIGIKGDVRSLSDIKGKKIRAVGAMSTLMSDLGATAVSIPSYEGYMALKVGTIDGWIAAPTTVSYGYKFYETADVYTVVTYPRLGAWTNSNVINLDSWNALPEDIRDMMEELLPMQKTWSNALVGYDWARNVVSYLEGQGLLQAVQFSEADASVITQAAYKQWDDKYAKKSANMARLVELSKRMVAAWGRPFPGYKPGW